MSRYVDADWLKAFFEADKGKSRNVPIDSLLALIDDAPSIEMPQWIPCNERLPNDGDRIVVQYANGDSGVINSCRMRLWNIINSPYATVVAWMPLPKPWKGADDE